jgi:hypothetical protein
MARGYFFPNLSHRKKVALLKVPYSTYKDHLHTDINSLLLKISWRTLQGKGLPSTSSVGYVAFCEHAPVKSGQLNFWSLKEENSLPLP